VEADRDHHPLMTLRRRLPTRRRAPALIAAALAASLVASALAAPAPLAAHGTVHTDTLWAPSLGNSKALTVYLPPSYPSSPKRRYPVLVYLHGLSGNERNWVDNGHLAQTLDSLVSAGQPEAIVVMPDGDDSWYMTWYGLPDMPGCRADTSRKESADSYCVFWPHYDDYIAHDIVNFVDGRYRTVRDAKHRAIAGLSMGGFGAVSLALSYPDVFGAAASHSGVVSPRYLAPGQYATNAAELQRAAGVYWKSMAPAFGRDTIAWTSHDPGRMAARLRARGAAIPQLLIDCGVDDQFIQQNRDFHQTLLRLGVSHRYAEWPGAHTWAYWRAHSVESLQFLLAAVSTP
jgi:putative tributyrin esterase